MSNINLLGHYIWKRIQKDNTGEKSINRPREYMTGFHIGPSDIQRYINDYFEYGIDYTGDDNECADDRIEWYWDFPEGKEE